MLSYFLTMGAGLLLTFGDLTCAPQVQDEVGSLSPNYVNTVIYLDAHHIRSLSDVEALDASVPEAQADTQVFTITK